MSPHRPRFPRRPTGTAPFAFALALSLGSVALGWQAPPAGARTPEAPPAPTCADRALSNEVARELGALFVTQRPDGGLAFGPPHRFYETYPVVATFALHARRGMADPSFLSRSAAAIARHYQHVFSTRDRNRNLLIETDVSGPDGQALTVEDVGVNSLLALDMASLAQLHIELRKPMRALYWYEGSRAIQNAVVSHCFDPASGFFYAVDVRRSAPVQARHTLSALPVLWPHIVGENLAGRLVSHYLIGAERPSGYPTLAARGVSTTAAPAARDVAIAAKRLEAVLISDVLMATGFGAKAEEERTNASRAIESAAAQQARPYLRLLDCQLARTDGQPFHARGVALEILRAVIRGKRHVADNEIVRATRAVESILTALRARPPGKIQPDALEASIRDVYRAVSLTRDAVRRGTFFSHADRNELSGVSAESALEHLFDDVDHLLRVVQNQVFRMRHSDTGLHATATLLRERAVPGEEVELRWSIATLASKAKLRSVVALYGQQTDTLLAPEEPASIRPGEPLSLTSRLRLRDGAPGSLAPLTVTLVIVDAEGASTRCHAQRTVFLDQAVEIEARFPRGRALAGATVPIDLHVIKRTSRGVTVRGGWHSPAGLRLERGNSIQFTIGAEDETASARCQVLVPAPCRPGRFPFKFTFSSTEQDLGVIQSYLYKPFQWLVIGPFAAGANPLGTPHPPERSFDIYKSYDGAGGRAAWRLLPPQGHLRDGTVVVREALQVEGIAYLYTVIRSPYDAEVPAFLSCTAPAALFVNGRRVIAEASSSLHDPAYERVPLRQGLNDILVKIHGDKQAFVFFDLGDDRSIAPDEFSNNLWELVEGMGHIASVEKETGRDEEVRKIVTLRYVDATANSVSVIGSFNGWSPENSRLLKVSDDTWEVTLSLLPGKYTYRFLINNRRQVLDPTATLTEADGYGGKNSVLEVQQ